MGRITICDPSGAILKYLYQWDVGQNIVISGIESDNVTEVHFAHPNSDNAQVVKPYVTESGIVATIPDILLQSAMPIMLYLVHEPDALSSRTIGAGRITVVPRAKPIDYI